MEGLSNLLTHFLPQFFPLLIGLTSLGLISLGSLPPFRMNRSTLSLVGAIFLLALQPDAYLDSLKFINGPTLLLLFSMMVLNSNLGYAGFFNVVASKLIIFVNNPRLFLLIIMLLTAILSAFLVNDTLIMVFTPLLMEILFRTKMNPYPYLMGIAFSVNIGSMATLIGNPQNILIGTSSGMSFNDFSLLMAPISLFLLLFTYLIIILTQPITKPQQVETELKVRFYKPLIIKSILGFTLMIIAFFSGMNISLAALIGISLVLITRRISPDKVFSRVDLSLMVLFSGLFIITGSIRSNILFQDFSNYLTAFVNQNPIHFVWIGPLLSQIISNVPTTMLLIPIIENLPNPTLFWLLLSGTTTLAGNLTLIGSVANLILAESASRKGFRLGFFQYLKLGLPVSVLTILIFALYLKLFFGL